MAGLNTDRLILATAAASTSFVFFGTLIDEQRGVIPLLTGRIKNKGRPTPQTRVGFFAAYLPRAGLPIITATNVSMILSFYTSYTHPSHLIRRLGFASGVSCLLLTPITFGLGILKINSELGSISKMDDRLIEEKSERIDHLVKTWEKKHMWRFISYAGAWAASFTALVLDGAV